MTQVGLHFGINGSVKQSGTTADMIFDVPELISFVSRIMRLEVSQCRDQIDMVAHEEVGRGFVVDGRTEGRGSYWRWGEF